MKVTFIPDIIPRGRLGSKHQLTNLVNRLHVSYLSIAVSLMVPRTVDSTDSRGRSCLSALRVHTTLLGLVSDTRQRKMPTFWWGQFDWTKPDPFLWSSDLWPCINTRWNITVQERDCAYLQRIRDIQNGCLTMDHEKVDSESSESVCARCACVRACVCPCVCLSVRLSVSFWDDTAVEGTWKSET